MFSCNFVSASVLFWISSSILLPKAVSACSRSSVSFLISLANCASASSRAAVSAFMFSCNFVSASVLFWISSSILLPKAASACSRSSSSFLISLANCASASSRATVSSFKSFWLAILLICTSPTLFPSSSSIGICTIPVPSCTLYSPLAIDAANAVFA